MPAGFFDVGSNPRPSPPNCPVCSCLELSPSLEVPIKRAQSVPTPLFGKRSLFEEPLSLYGPVGHPCSERLSGSALFRSLPYSIPSTDFASLSIRRQTGSLLLLANLDHNGAHACTARIFPVCLLNFVEPEGSLNRHGDFS